ncbi:hypothetical protein EDD86DRAFT_248200 [Gorgonomyces haynaldii]|nr:hypothetical protein EDD86DRAFT_248200 [Gorgonomyces haynaldii]
MFFASKRSLSTLLVIDHKAGKIASGNLNAVTAAQKLNGKITCLVAGNEGAEEAAKQASQLPGVEKVLLAKDPSLDHLLAEYHSPVIAGLVKNGGFTHVVGAHTAYTKNVFPRVGALLDVSPVPDVIEIESADVFKRPIYAGNAIAKVKSNDPVKVISVRTTAFAASEAQGGSAAVESSAPEKAQSTTKWLQEQIAKSDRPELGAAKVVIGGGRGMKSGDNFELLYKLADKVGGAVGASRAAVDAGFVSNDLQIGQTGKIIAPQLYVAHLAGMKDSKTIVAINKDAEAPIFQVADYGLVADLLSQS